MPTSPGFDKSPLAAHVAARLDRYGFTDATVAQPVKSPITTPLHPRVVQLALSVVALVSLPACDPGPPAWRTYEEISTRPDSSASTGTQAAYAPVVALRWAAPPGWKETIGSGMRLATFEVTGREKTGRCTISRMAGDAGGLEANVHRWIRQLDLVDPSSAELASFLAKQEHIHSEGGLDGVLVDLTTMGGRGQDVGSMLAAMFPLGDSTAFVKLTGPVSLLDGERDSFIALCRSLRRGE